MLEEVSLHSLRPSKIRWPKISLAPWVCFLQLQLAKQNKKLLLSKRMKI